MKYKHTVLQKSMLSRWQSTYTYASTNTSTYSFHLYWITLLHNYTSHVIHSWKIQLLSHTSQRQMNPRQMINPHVSPVTWCPNPVEFHSLIHLSWKCHSNIPVTILLLVNSTHSNDKHTYPVWTNSDINPQSNQLAYNSLIPVKVINIQQIL